MRHRRLQTLFVAGCGWLLAAAPAHTPRTSPTSYRGAAELRPAPVSSTYLPAPREPEPETFDLATLRSSVTRAGDGGYVDPSRFRALRSARDE